MIGLLVAIAGAIIAGSIAKKRKRRNVTTRTVSARNLPKPKTPEQLEKDRLRTVAAYNRRIKAELEKNQAKEDIYHLEQRKADLLRAYEQIPDADTERNIRRRIAYDNAIRNTDKQIEKAYMILHRTY